MAINRVHSSEAQLFVDDQRIPAVISLDISSSKEIEYIPRLGAGHSVEGVLMPNQNSTLSYGITLTTGATGIDPFYSYLHMWETVLFLLRMELCRGVTKAQIILTVSFLLKK